MIRIDKYLADCGEFNIGRFRSRNVSQIVIRRNTTIGINNKI